MSNDPISPEEVTTQDIFAATGLRTYGALSKWIKRGILMAPIGKVSRGEAGVWLIWPRGALEQARWFGMMRARGKRGWELLAILEGRAVEHKKGAPAAEPKRTRRKK